MPFFPDVWVIQQSGLHCICHGPSFSNSWILLSDRAGEHPLHIHGFTAMLKYRLGLQRACLRPLCILWTKFPYEKLLKIWRDFFSPVELPGKPYIFTKENPSLYIGTTFLAVAVHVRGRRDLCGLLLLEIHFTRSGSLKQKTRAQQKPKESHLVTWVLWCVSIFPILSLHWRSEDVLWSSSSFHIIRHFACFHKLVFALSHPPVSERPWKHISTGYSWTLIQTRSNLFPVRRKVSV